MPVRLVISICHPLLLVSCNDRRGVDYATALTQALLQVLASYSKQRCFQLPRLNSHSHALNSHSHPIPIRWLILLPFPQESHGTHGIPVFPIPMHTSSLDVSDSMEAHDSSRYCACAHRHATLSLTLSRLHRHDHFMPKKLRVRYIVISLCLRRRRIMSPICPSICVCVSG